jgi:hypothetical protein
MRFVAVVCAAAISTPAFADQLVLRDGQVLEGAVQEDGEVVSIRLDVGVIGFAREEVKEIRRGESAIAEFDQRLARVSPTSAAELKQLALWAESKGLTTRATQTWRRVLELQPDEATARERLGHQRHDGKWMTEDEVMLARGLVRYGGAWRTPEEVRASEAELAEKKLQRAAKKEVEPEEKKKEIEEEEYRWSDGFWPSHPAYALHDAAIGDLMISGFASPFFLFRAPRSLHVPPPQRPTVPVGTLRKLEIGPIGPRTIPRP